MNTIPQNYIKGETVQFKLFSFITVSDSPVFTWGLHCWFHLTMFWTDSFCSIPKHYIYVEIFMFKESVGRQFSVRYDTGLHETTQTSENSHPRSSWPEVRSFSSPDYMSTEVQNNEIQKVQRIPPLDNKNMTIFEDIYLYYLKIRFYTDL